VKTAMKNSTEQKGLDSAAQNVELPVIGGKTCSRCKIIKPLNNDYFFTCNNHKNRYPFKSMCKDCYGVKGKRKNHLGNGFKICSKCREEKPATKDHFNRQNNKIDNLRPDCKECTRKASREIYNKIPTDKKTEYRKNYYSQNKDRLIKAQKEWNDENRGKVRHYKSKRKMRVKRATPTWFEKDLVEAVYQNACSRGWEVDHIVPIKSDIVCGLHCHDNLQILDKELNRRKSNSHWPDMP
jgi:hypothetical protein